MFGGIRRVSRFASEAELADTAEVIARGGIVGVPSHAGLMLVGLVEKVDDLRALGGGADPAQLVGSVEQVTGAKVLPVNLLRWFTKLTQTSLGDIWLPAPSERNEEAAPAPKAGSAFSKIANRLGIGQAEDAGADAPLPALHRHHVIRMADTQVAKTLCAMLRVPLVSVVPVGADGRGLTTAEAAKRLRNGVETILSVTGTGDPVTPRRAIIMRAGAAISRPVSGESGVVSCQPHRVMFVCIGNLNRSPYAECHLRALMRREALVAAKAGFDYCPAYEPGSSGIAAMPGTPATDGMLWASKVSLCWPELEKHAARRYTPVLAQDYDEIFPLDAGVAGTVREFDTGGVPVTFSKHQDLPDPMGKSEADFRETATLIEEYIARHFLMAGVDLPPQAKPQQPRGKGHRNSYEDLYRQ